MHHRPPFEDLAFPNFRREFGDLFSVRAEVTDYEAGFVMSIYSQLWLMHIEREERARWSRTVRAAHHYLDQGALKDTRAVAEAFMRIAEQLPHALNGVHAQGAAVEKAIDSDTRLRAQLAYYKALLEGVVTIAAAPIVVGFALVYNANKAKEFVPKPDGRVGLRAIESMERWSVTPSHRLKEGINSHIRNAYAHERYRLLDGERVGPETWTCEQLEALGLRLHVTCLAMVMALVIFGMNYRALIRARGWVPRDIQRVPLRLDEARHMAEQLADLNSFTLTEFRRVGESLHVGLTTHHQGIDQEEEILVGGDGWGESYKRPVRYEEVLVVEYVIGVLQRVSHNVDDVVRYRADVKSPDGQPNGELVITREALMRMRGRSGAGIEEDRRLAEVDTLGASKMWLRIESPIQRVGGGRTGPRSRIIVP
jgi:hypothetical protein